MIIGNESKNDFKKNPRVVHLKLEHFNPFLKDILRKSIDMMPLWTLHNMEIFQSLVGYKKRGGGGGGGSLSIYSMTL